MTSRYDRQMRLPEIGAAGQQKLREATVLIVGAGGLGVPAAMYLAAAGVGTLRIVDFDAVDATNLHRQVLYATSDVGVPKVQAASARLRVRNPDVRVETTDAPFNSDNAMDLVAGADLVLDGTDSFSARYLVNDACVLSGVPNVFGSVSSFSGQVSVFANNGPCYRCLFPEPPPAGLVPSCADAGVLGVVPGLVGMLQATEALKLLLGIGRSLTGRLLMCDALEMEFREIRVERDPACAVCGTDPSIRTIHESALSIQSSCSPPASDVSTPAITVQNLKERLDAGDDLFLLDVRNPDEHAFTDLGGSALIPLPQLAERADELKDQKEREIVVYCRSGGRSRVAVDMLRQRGYDATNLTGGILAWGEQIDPTIQAY